MKCFRRKSFLALFPLALELGNTVLFHIEICGGKVNGTALAMYLKNATTRSSFTRLKVH